MFSKFTEHLEVAKTGDHMEETNAEGISPCNGCNRIVQCCGYGGTEGCVDLPFPPISSA